MKDGTSVLLLFALNIGEINAELKTNRPVTMVCTACGSALPEGARFCPACGVAVPRPAPQDSVLFSHDASQNQEDRADGRNESVDDKGGEDSVRPQQTEHNRRQSSIVSKISDASFTTQVIILSPAFALFVISLIACSLLKEYEEWTWSGPFVFIALVPMISILMWSIDGPFLCCPVFSMISALVLGIIYFIPRGVSAGYIIGTTGALMGGILGALLGWLFHRNITSERGRITLGIITGIASAILVGFLVP
jgi:hypothetical protein